MPNFKFIRDISYAQITHALLIILSVVSYKIWIGNPHIPRFPLVESFSISDGLSTAILIGLCTSSILFLILGKKVFTILSFSLLSLAIFLDFNKAQPYYYMVWILLLCELVSSKNKPTNYVIPVLACMYVWAGIQKYNIYFFDYGLDYMVYELPEFLKSTAKGIFGLLPFIEVILGLTLIFNKSRMISHYLLFAMHIGVLVYLITIDYNYMVWPWNLALALINLKLIYDKDGFNWQINRTMLVGIGFAGLVPLINVFSSNLSYLSWNVYSYRIPQGQLMIDARHKNELPENIRHNLDTGKDISQTNLTYYSMDKTLVSLNPEPWIYRRYFKDVICKDQSYSDNGPFMVIYTYEFDTIHQEVISCAK